MNRRNFIVSSVMSAGALSMLPSSVLANNESISISSIGKGFDKLLHSIGQVTVSSLPNNVIKTHEKLMNVLDKSEYVYNAAEVVKLSENCYAIPLYKKPLLGFNTKELALIVKENNSSEFYILNEEVANEFSSLIDNFSHNNTVNELNLDTIAFALPNKVVKQTTGKESSFVYKNKLNNTITIKKHKSVASARIC